MESSLPFAEACERNKRPILDVLCREFPEQGVILELGSGTGQHLVYFASRLTGLMWQPSDLPENLEGLAARIRQEGGSNILPVMELDVLQKWPSSHYDAVYSSNTSHIMNWLGVCAMFAGIGAHLKAGGVFCLYGPFSEHGDHTSPSNAAFDRQLRQRDPGMGLRDVMELEKLAARHQMGVEKQYQMPANNQLLVFRGYGT